MENQLRDGFWLLICYNEFINEWINEKSIS